MPADPGYDTIESNSESLSPYNVVNFERLVDLGEPFGAVGGTSTAALIKRQLQLAEQTRDLFPRGDVAEIRAGAERGFIDVVQRGKPAWKEFAINHAFGEPVD
jgi:hypothetical protein